MRAVMYGAGNIGRGFIGQLFSDSGYEVTFIDVDEKIVEALNNQGRYPIRFISNEGNRDVWIKGVKAVNGNDREKTAEVIAAADIMATAVGVRVLPFIAPVIAEGIKKRFARGNEPLNIIICENLIEADKMLAALIKEKLNTEEQRLFDERIGLVESSIGRMVPLQTSEMQDGNLLRICSEEYGFLPVNKNAIKGKIPEMKGMTAFDTFDFFIKQKLFVHNMGHGLCAYLGMYLGDTYIYESVKREEILFLAQNAMLESAMALSAKYKFPITDIYLHIRDLMRRFSNRALEDTCARVGGDTRRKLGAEDRFIGTIRFCEGEAVKPVFVSIGAAAALYQYLKENNIQQSRKAAAKVLAEISAINEGSSISKLILSMYSLLIEKNDSQVLQRLINAAFF